jgi:putative transposase
MGVAYIQKGAVVSYENRVATLKREVSADTWQLEDNRTGYLETKTVEEILLALEAGELKFIMERDQLVKMPPSKALLIDANDKSFDRAKLKRQCIKAVENLPATKRMYEAAMQELWNAYSLTQPIPHWITVRRWVLQFVKGARDIQALLEQHQRKGNRSNRYPDAVIEVVEKIIDNVYLTTSRPTQTRVLELATAEIQDTNQWAMQGAQLPLPSARLVKRLIEQIPAFDRDVARRGATVARRMYRGKLNHIETNQRLEVAEIDHTQLDIFVVDDEGIPLGRPWLTVCIDKYTRCILGIYIGFEPPSYLSVARCLKHALKPKLSLQTEYPSIKNVWEAFGVMKMLVVDNGMEFHSGSFEKACYQFDIEIKYTPRKSPWFKGTVERFMRTINNGVSHGNPGTTFSNIFEKEDYNPEKHAVIRYSVFKEIVFKWIVDYYHQKPHAGLERMKPADAWRNADSVSNTPVATNLEVIDMLLGRHEECSLTHKGVQANQLLYNSRDMIDWRKQCGDKLTVEVLVDEGNLGQVHIKHPVDGHYVAVPALNQEYAQGLSLWQHKLYRKYAKNRIGQDNEKGWMRASRDIHEIVLAEGGFKKANARLRAKRGRLIEDQKRTQHIVEQYQEAEADLLPDAAMMSLSLNEVEGFSAIVQERRK